MPAPWRAFPDGFVWLDRHRYLDAPKAVAFPKGNSPLPVQPGDRALAFGVVEVTRNR